jgi:hypothetical protein
VQIASTAALAGGADLDDGPWVAANVAQVGALALMGGALVTSLVSLGAQGEAAREEDTARFTFDRSLRERLALVAPGAAPVPDEAATE